jgi:hypothetical protein
LERQAVPPLADSLPHADLWSPAPEGGAVRGPIDPDTGLPPFFDPAQIRGLVAALEHGQGSASTGDRLDFVAWAEERLREGAQSELVMDVLAIRRACNGRMSVRRGVDGEPPWVFEPLPPESVRDDR